MSYKKYILLIILVLISIIPIFDFFKIGLPLTHDGQDHVARIANFYQNLSEGNIIPRWAGNLNWGYGHPILQFLYPLPSYFASLFHFFGFGLVDSLKLVFGVSFILSGIVMYVFIKELLNDDKAAFFAGALYIIAPYRFVDLYVRGAIGEHVAFIFPPLIFYFLIKLSKKNSYKYILGGSLSLAGLILSHNAITIMFLPLIFLYILCLIFQYNSKKYFILNTLYLILFGFGLSAFFLIPAFLEGKYTLRDIVTSNREYMVSFVPWKDFFFGQWSYGGTLQLSKQIGIIHWFSIVAAVVIAIRHYYKKKDKLWAISMGCFVIFLITLFLMTSSSSFVWQSITILQKFQFPWRFLSVTVFLSALMGGILFTALGKLKNILLAIFVMILLVINKDYWHANGFLHKPESFYAGIYNGTTDTGESAPIWSVRFMEKRPRSKLEIIEGNGEIKELMRNLTRREYQVKTGERMRILENTLYFPGWNVLIDGKQETIEFQDQNYRGLITFYVSKGTHKVSIIYEETKIRLLADVISVVSLLAVGSLIILTYGRKQK